jgi:signal transduction histidine kinase/DNA-binding response OmpR family regulator
VRVLYAEPNAVDSDLTRRYLARHAPHIRLEVVGSGTELLTRLPMTAGGTAPPCDVVLLDFRLPGLDALEVVKIIRRERGLNPPIVLVTGRGTEEAAVQALRLGADDYLVKHEGYLHQLPAILEKVWKQAQLNMSEERYRHLSQEFHGLLDAIPDSLMLIDRELKVLWANRAAAEGIDMAAEEPASRHCYTLCYGRATPCEPCPVMKCFESGSFSEVTVTRPDGRTWNIRTVPLPDEQGGVAKVIVLKRDISEQKKLEMQYLHAQKMESIGTLAGGVAHDFNNILTVIVGFGELTLMKTTEDDPRRRNIRGILEAAERASYLTKELLFFSRRERSERRAVDLNDIVDNMEKFLHRLIGAGIVVKRIPHGAPLPVLADSSQLGQVLMNLAVNAKDAMPGGGEFILRTELVHIGEEVVLAQGMGKPGPYALLSVSDTGSGMDAKTLQRIFEPFFTTKEEGKGTGLGLAVVYGIIRQHEGFINVYSEPGCGSTFRIYLPLTAEARREAVMEPEEPVPGGTETILIAEDNELVRDLLTSVLSEAGYRVIVAIDGEEAVRKFRDNADSIQLLILDMIMPKMSGMEASYEIRKVRPGIRIIFSSGYAPDIAQQKVTIEGIFQLIYKPFSPPELLRKVRNVLDGTW